MLARMQKNCIAGEYVKWYSHCKKIVQQFLIKHDINIQLRNCTLMHVLQKNKNLCSHKNPYINVHCSFSTSSKLATIQMPFNGWMGRPWVHAYHGAPCRSEMDQATDTRGNLDKSQRIYAQREKKPVSKGCILYDFIYVIFLKWWYPGGGELIGGCQRLGIKWEEKRNVDIVIKGQHEGSLQIWKMSGSGLWWWYI